MTSQERSDSGSGLLSEKPANRRGEEPGEQPSEDSATDERLGPRVVWPRGRERAAVQLAGSLTEAVAQLLQKAEKQVVSRAEQIRVSTLDDLEKQRASVESLIGLFAERLREHEAGVSALQEEMAGVHARHVRHAEALRAISDAEARQLTLLGQLLTVLQRLAAVTETPPDQPQASFQPRH